MITPIRSVKYMQKEDYRDGRKEGEDDSQGKERCDERQSSMKMEESSGRVMAMKMKGRGNLH